MFVPVKPLQPGLMFAGKAGALLSEAPSSAAPLQALTANIRPDWKGLTGTNKPAYYEHE